MRKFCPHRLEVHVTVKDNSSMSDFSPWQLDDDPSNRQRYTKSEVKRGQTELIQCRADAFQVRRVDEIVASRIDPVLKTRSDVMQDALCMWLEDWDTKYPDGAGGELSYTARIEAMGRKRKYRLSFIESAEEELRGLEMDADILGLGSLLQTLLLAQGDFKDDAPVTYLERLNVMILKCRRMIDASRML